MDPTRVRRLDTLARTWVEEGQTPALVTLVARRGVVVHHSAHGRLHPEPYAPALPLDAIFPIASLTKPVTATLVMQLVEEGLLGLNRPVQEYVPEFVGEGKEAVMVHHLLTHTAGYTPASVAGYLETFGEPLIPAEHADDPLARRWPAMFSPDLAHRAPLTARVGAEMSYTGFAYNLLAEIVERLRGRPFDEVAAARVFEPLRMASTSVGASIDRSRALLRGNDVFLPELGRWPAPRAAWGSAGIYSTAWDMARFGQAILNGGALDGQRILSRASVREMTRNQIPGVPATFRGESFPEASWGYGWNVHGDKKFERDGSLRSGATYSHSGAGGVFMWVDPVHEIVGVYFSVVRAMLPRSGYGWNCDLFVDAATAAVVD